MPTVDSNNLMLHFTIDKNDTYEYCQYVEVKCNEIKSSNCIQQAAVYPGWCNAKCHDEVLRDKEFSKI